MPSPVVPLVRLERSWYRIGEVSKLLGVEPHVLRYWESEFRGLRMERSKSGQRVYSRAVVERFVWIRHLLYVERYTIEGARRKLRGGPLTCPGCGLAMPREEGAG